VVEDDKANHRTSLTAPGDDVVEHAAFSSQQRFAVRESQFERHDGADGPFNPAKESPQSA
jgi:hypothetical protein